MKIKYTVLSKLNTLGRKEMDLFLYLVRHMDQAAGKTERVYYRQAMEKAGMCKQSFYNALWGLEARGIIEVEKISEVEYDILIVNNDFLDEAACRERYVNLNHKVFYVREFWELKAHEKYMLLEFLKGIQERGCFWIGAKAFYKKYEGLLGVSKRAIRGYLHSLKKFFAVGIRDGKYCITCRNSMFRDLSKDMVYAWGRDRIEDNSRDE